MWPTILKLAPVILGTVSKGAGLLTGKVEKNQGATLGTLIGGAGLFSNPTFMGFLADTLTRLADMLRNIPPQ